MSAMRYPSGGVEDQSFDGIKVTTAMEQGASECGQVGPIKSGLPKTLCFDIFRGICGFINVVPKKCFQSLPCSTG